MTPHPVHEDPALRTLLRQGLDTTGHGDSEALQARVLAQWQQRHAVASPMVASAGSAALRPPGRRPVWLASGALLAAALLLTLATWQRPDPGIDELMQLDVLSEMALGAM